MAEIVNIASLKIDVDDVIKKSGQLKKQIDSLKAAQKALDTSTVEGAQAFAKNEAELKNLSKAYRDNQNFAAALEATNKDLEATMSVQNKSTQELRDSRSRLNQISKNIKGDTEEEIKLREDLNKAIDEQTQALREQSSDFNKNKDRVGEYKDSILEAVEELMRQKTVLEQSQQQLEANLKTLDKGTEEYEQYSLALTKTNNELESVNKQLGENEEQINLSDLSLSNLLESSKNSGGAFKLLKGGLKAAVSGMWSFIKASAAFVLSPVGAVIAALAAAFLLVKNAMDRNEKTAAKLKRALAAFSGIIKTLLGVLEPLGEFIVDGLVKSFEMLEKGLTKALEAIQKSLKFLGLDKAAASMENFNKKVEEGAKISKELVDAQLAYDKAQRQARITQLKFQKDAEKLRQIRDDENKTIKERIKANEDLGKTLKKQTEEELKLAQNALNVANLRIKLEGETKDNLDKRAEALTEIADIEERITGQESEQLTNRVALEKDAKKKIEDAKKAAAKKQKELEKQQEEEAKKLAEQRVKIAQSELDEYIRNNKTKLDSDKFLTQEALKEEQNRLDQIAQKRKDFAALQLEQGKIDQVDYNNQIAAIDEENEAKKKEVAIQKEEAEKEKQAIDFANKLEVLDSQAANEFEVAQRWNELDRQREVQEAEKTGANIELINKKYAARERAINEALSDQKLQDSKELFGGIRELLGENTAAGKAAGIAQATINTYQGVTEVWKTPSTLPEPFATISKAANTGIVLGSGLSAVSKITSTPTKFSEGDILSGKSHAMGGIPFTIAGQAGFEAEGGEAIINKKSTALYRPLLSAINVAGGGKKFANGGIAGSSTSNTTLIDYDRLIGGIAESLQNLPTPVVSVSEINEVSGNVSAIEDLSTL